MQYYITVSILLVVVLAIPACECSKIISGAETCACHGRKCTCCLPPSSTQQRSVCLKFTYDARNLIMNFSVLGDRTSLTNSRTGSSSMCVPYYSLTTCVTPNYVNFEENLMDFCSQTDILSGSTLVYSTKLPCLTLVNGQLSTTANYH